MDFSKVIIAMATIESWRFILLWVWLMTIALSPFLYQLLKAITNKKGD
jgi:hypothetical protein